MTTTLGAVAGGLRDVVSARLRGLSLLCLAGALALTVLSAWAAVRYLVPLIPIGDGLLGGLGRALHWLAGAAIVVIALSLAPGISMVLGGALFDVAAGRVEATLGVPPGRDASIVEGLIVGARIGLPAMAVSVLSLPLVLVPVVHVALFALINGYLMGREHFTLAALRRMSWEEARALRRRLWLPVLAIGLVGTAIPLVAPLYGASAMTRLIAARRLIDVRPS